MCFGSGGSQTNSVAEFKPPEWTQEQWKQAIAAGDGLFGQGYKTYGGMMPGAAPVNSDMMAAKDLVYQRATLGAPELNAARGMAADMAGGVGSENPYASNDYTGQVIRDNADVMANSYATGTAADQARNAQMASRVAPSL